MPARKLHSPWLLSAAQREECARSGFQLCLNVQFGTASAATGSAERGHAQDAKRLGQSLSWIDK